MTIDWGGMFAEEDGDVDVEVVVMVHVAMGLLLLLLFNLADFFWSLILAFKRCIFSGLKIVSRLLVDFVCVVAVRVRVLEATRDKEINNSI